MKYSIKLYVQMQHDTRQLQVNTRWLSIKKSKNLWWDGSLSALLVKKVCVWEREGKTVHPWNWIQQREHRVLHCKWKKIQSKGVVSWKDGCLSIQWKWPFIPTGPRTPRNKISYCKEEHMNIAIKPKGASLSWGSNPKNKQLGNDPK